jgi:hypothetical protein
MREKGYYEGMRDADWKRGMKGGKVEARNKSRQG